MNKKGFTLIELLAVIIILAVIALIATPIVLDVIDDAKFKAAENSAKGFVDAARYYFIEDEFENIGNEGYQRKNTASVTAIDVQGERPDGCQEVTWNEGKIGYTGCKWGDWTFNCVDGNVTRADS